MRSPLDRVEVDSFKFQCVMISKGGSDWGRFDFFSEYQRSQVRSFNCQNLRLMLIVFVYISSRFDAIHSPNVRRNMKRQKSVIKLLFWVSRLFKVA